MKDLLTRRPRLALPYTIIPGRGAVRLAAGEDFRYTLSGPGIESWLPGLLTGLDGRQPLERALGSLSRDCRGQALELIKRLYSERILHDAPAEAAHPVTAYQLQVTGTGALVEMLRGSVATDDGTMRPSLAVFCQDRLDFDAALEFNRRCRTGTGPWLWTTYGPMARGYVSPVFLPDAGPCLACLLRHFQRLSPVPALYTDLLDHARRGGVIAPVPFPPEGLEVLRALVLWKRALLSEPVAVAALYQLHVLEVESLEVTAHAVLADPECPDCGEGE
jgi:bacteriocin biosynthesis cyclodehydratase domain-containing protein